MARPTDHIKRAARHSSWVDRMTRVGYATRGVVFSLVGVLSMRVAIGLSGTTEGIRGAFREIGQQPFGRLLLGLTAMGLGCYVVWRFIQLAVDPGHDKEGAYRIRRVAYGLSGVFYALLAFTAGQMALRSGPQGRSDLREVWTAWLLQLPYGAWIVGFIAVIILGLGVQTLYRVYRSQFMQLYRQQRMTEEQRVLAQRIGQVGLTALAVTFFVIGFLLLHGAIKADPDQAVGIGGALEVVAAQPYGPWLLWVTSVGFVVYGVHCFMLARFRRVSPE